MEDIFRGMMQKGALQQADPKQLALEYYAPLHLLIQISDGAHNRAANIALLKGHIERFMQRNAAGDQ